MLPRRFLPSITALCALEALERLGTVSAVAEEMALTQGAVSRQIQGLELQLGVALARREKQRLILTDAALIYVQEARKALKILADASLSLRANPVGGGLSLAILPAFGMHWLAPRLARFAAIHPEITLNLSTRLRPFDLEESAFDAAIHYGRMDWPGVSYLKLMDETIMAVAAPSLLQGAPAGLDGLLQLPLLQLESRTGDWGRWFSHYGRPGLRPKAMMFDQFATMAQAAIHGMGVALLPGFLIGEDLAQGRLQLVFGHEIPALGSYYLVWPKARAPRPGLLMLCDWLQQARPR